MKTKKVLNFLTRELVYNGHLQSFGAVSIVYLSSFFLNIGIYSPLVFLHVYFMFQFIYTNDRYVDIELDLEDNYDRWRHLKSYLDKIPFLMILYLILAFICFYKSINLSLLTLSLTILILGYLYPYYFKDITKKIPTFKNWYVSLVHGCLIFYPSLVTNKRFFISHKELLIFLFIFVQIMIGQVLLDVKDIKTDKSSKLKTIPVMLGKTKALSYISLLNYVVLLCSIPLYILWGWQITVITLFSFFATSVSLRYINRNDFRGYLLVVLRPSLWFILLLLYSVL